MSEPGEAPYVFQVPWARLKRQSRLAAELADYVARTWYAQRRAHAHAHHESSPPNGGGYYYAGVSALQHMNREDWLAWQGRERELFIRSWSRDVRVAFRMCDLAVQYPERYGYMKLADLARRAARAVAETEGERSVRLKRRFELEQALVRAALNEGGLPAVFDIAGLAHEERIVADLTFSGRTLSLIAEATGKTENNVKQLRHKAFLKLRALTLDSQEVA